MRLTLRPVLAALFALAIAGGPGMGPVLAAAKPTPAPSPSQLPPPPQLPKPSLSEKPGTKPVKPPSAKPAAKPIANPTAKPGVKPPAKPAPKPAAKPAPKKPAKAPPKPAAKKGGKDPKAKKEVDERVHITSDYMKYDRKAKTALATGNVVIVQEDTTIHTAEVQFDQRNKISYMNQPVKVVQQKDEDPPTLLDAKRMTTFHREKRLIAEGDVRFVRVKNPRAKPKSKAKKDKIQAAIKKEDTVINSEELEYWTQKKDAHFKRNVTMLNGKKKAWGDSAFMDNAKDETTLDGHVKVVQINGNWLIKEKIVEADEPDEARDEALRERAVLTCDHLVIDNKTSDAVATGELVRIEQKGKVATGKKAVFSDRKNTITMTENVRIQQANGDWLTATKAIFNTESEVFEAFSGGQTQVQSEFEVPDEKKEGEKKPGAAKPDDRVEAEFELNEDTQ